MGHHIARPFLFGFIGLERLGDFRIRSAAMANSSGSDGFGGPPGAGGFGGGGRFGDSPGGFGGPPGGPGFGGRPGGAADSSHGDYRAPAGSGPTDFLAIVSMVTGILSLLTAILFCCCCAPLAILPAIAAIVTGLLSLRSIAHSIDGKQGKGYAYTGIGTGAVALLVSGGITLAGVLSGSFDVKGLDEIQTEIEELQRQSSQVPSPSSTPDPSLGAPTAEDNGAEESVPLTPDVDAVVDETPSENEGPSGRSEGAVGADGNGS